MAGQLVVGPSSAPGRALQSRPVQAHLVGLDGIRAIAITAVVIFHLNPAWLPGGFLGVDMFFVVSGFLITTLLVRERARTGRIDFRAFWTRRARRLLPALLACVAGSVVLARLVEGDLLVGIGRQVLGALTFSSNWLEIGAGSDYFNATTPQLFMNLWSLAVEEQFYLLWPVVVVAAVSVMSTSRQRAAFAGVLALSSAIAMALLFDPDAGATRVYYGTDTHLMGLMAGAALAFAYAAPNRAGLHGGTWARWRRPVSMAATLALLATLLVLDESSTWTFRGGIGLACLATTALVAAAVSGQGTLPRVLETSALRWIGERSYGIYLWHWPVILFVAQDIPTAPGGPGFLTTRAWCVLVTVALADLSYRFVETPIRRLGMRTALRRGGAKLRLGTLRAGPILASGLIVVLVVVAAVIATAPRQTSTQRLIEGNAAAASQGSRGRISIAPGSPASSASSARTSTPAASPPAGVSPTSGARTTFTMPKGKNIDAYGDSMMVGSLHALRYYFPGIRIDAKSNRQWSGGLKAVQASGHTIRRAVILSLGTNAGVEEDDLRATLDRLGRDRMIVVVNLHLNMARVKKDNGILAAAAADYPNVIVADWNAAATADPKQLQPDGIHPSLTGAHLYAKTIRAAFATLSERHTGRPVRLKELPIP